MLYPEEQLLSQYAWHNKASRKYVLPAHPKTEHRTWRELTYFSVGQSEHDRSTVRIIYIEQVDNTYFLRRMIGHRLSPHYNMVFLQDGEEEGNDILRVRNEAMQASQTQSNKNAGFR